MKSKIEALGRIRKEFPPRGNVQLFQLDKLAKFTCSLRKVDVTSNKVALFPPDPLRKKNAPGSLSLGRA